MKKNIKKLQLKKTSVVLLNNNEKKEMNAGMQAATQPFVSCRIACLPSWNCPWTID
jgi:hypothetical protein